MPPLDDLRMDAYTARTDVGRHAAQIEGGSCYGVAVRRFATRNKCERPALSVFTGYVPVPLGISVAPQGVAAGGVRAWVWASVV